MASKGFSYEKNKKKRISFLDFFNGFGQNLMESSNLGLKKGKKKEKRRRI